MSKPLKYTMTIERDDDGNWRAVIEDWFHLAADGDTAYEAAALAWCLSGVLFSHLLEGTEDEKVVVDSGE